MERKFTLQRVKQGDYLLLSNDEQVVWRIATYTEDGSACYDDGHRLVGTFWGLWKRVGRSKEIDADEWSDFEMWDSLLRSRKEAVGSAMAEDRRRIAAKEADHGE